MQLLSDVLGRWPGEAEKRKVSILLPPLRIQFQNISLSLFFLNLCRLGVSVSARLSTPGAGYGPSGVTFQSPTSNPQYRSQSINSYLLIESCSFAEHDIAQWR